MPSVEQGAIKISTANAMGNILNKKMGVSTGFAPKDWADTLNLCGKAPEKTVSGAIAHIEDGADRVPVRSWQVTLGASLDGVSSLGCYVYGKNMIDLSSLVVGYVKTNGTFETAHSNGEMRSDFIPVKPDTTYYFSIFETTGTAADWVGIGEYTTNNTSGFVRRDSYWRFTTGSTTKYIVVSARNLEQATKIQLEVGNDPTTWEAYTAPTVSTVNLGRTIYGGSVDVVNGEGSETWYKPNMSSLTMRGNGINREGNIIRVYINEVLYGSNIYEIGLCNSLTFQSSYTAVNNNDHSIAFNSADRNQFLIREDSLSTATKEDVFDFIHGLTVVYPIATPTDFTFTPITPTPQTALGVNNFWVDEGDSQVTYRRDIDLALGGG